ncbi:ABC transporter substrate-binding protein [Bradyrhizobium sp. dw_78]|uniref:ABC transporter substrate-binding protein n=1 Tax=Bradyrhizobium sp. dw_78 TaxID=2719793 RepID=UPI001BD23FE3|nr:ABC transporter substrate-binding protein [Bradyrhizobium sp. dw_78]
MIEANVNTRWFGRYRAAVACLAAMFLVTPAAKAESVKLGQPAATTLTFGPIFAAMQLGYFKEENIDLEILDFSGSSTLLPLIANKTITFGFPGSDPLIVSRQPGRDPLPMKFVYNAARRNIWQFIVPENSPLKTIADLRGKTIGVAALGNATVQMTTAMLKEIGLTAGKDYSFQTIGMGPSAFRATLTGQVDTYNTYDTNIAAFAATGAELRSLPQPDKFRNLFSNGFIAHLDTIAQRPDLIIGFGRAVTKGILTCEVNPDFCVRNYYKMRPNLKPSGVSDEEAVAIGKRILESRMESYLAFPEGAPRRFGEYSEQDWKNHIEILYEGGVVTTKDIDPSTLYTNAFVDQINNFNVKEVQDRARQLK